MAGTGYDAAFTSTDTARWLSNAATNVTEEVASSLNAAFGNSGDAGFQDPFRFAWFFDQHGDGASPGSSGDSASQSAKQPIGVGVMPEAVGSMPHNDGTGSMAGLIQNPGPTSPQQAVPPALNGPTMAAASNKIGHINRPASVMRHDDETPTMPLSQSIMVGLNANDDNGSAFVSVGVPGTRDYNMSTNYGPDPDFVPIWPVYTYFNAPGYLSFAVTRTGTGNVHIWYGDSKESAHLDGGSPFRTESGVSYDTFFVEGISASSDLNDVDITVTFTGDGMAPKSNDIPVTVGPICKSFALNPAEGQQVTFIDKADPAAGIPADGLSGIWAVTAAAHGSMNFDAEVTVNGIAGSAIFIQDQIGDMNGGLMDGAGFDFTGASGRLSQYVRLKAGNSFPLLDRLDKGGEPVSPAYNGEFTRDSNDTRQVLHAEDGPTSGVPGGGASADLAQIDLQYNFSMYLVWRFNDGAMIGLAHQSWHCVLAANTNVPGKGVSVIVGGSGVFVDASPVKNQQLPPKMDGTLANYAFEIS
jgi:hypothetical protein